MDWFHYGSRFLRNTINIQFYNFLLDKCHNIQIPRHKQQFFIHVHQGFTQNLQAFWKFKIPLSSPLLQTQAAFCEHITILVLALILFRLNGKIMCMYLIITVFRPCKTEKEYWEICLFRVISFSVSLWP